MSKVVYEVYMQSSNCKTSELVDVCDTFNDVLNVMKGEITFIKTRKDLYDNCDCESIWKYDIEFKGWWIDCRATYKTPDKKPINIQIPLAMLGCWDLLYCIPILEENIRGAKKN